MLARGMVSCGALALIFATILRKFRIPVKLIHGRIRDTARDDRHAWVQIYDPLRKRWLNIDPTSPDFMLNPRAYPLKECVDWRDLNLTRKSRPAPNYAIRPEISRAA